MYKYAFLFFLDNKLDLQSDLDKYLSKTYIKNDNKSYILSQNIKLTTSENTIFIDKYITTKINIYAEESIFIIFTNRVKDINEFDFLLNYKPVNLTSNMFVKRIFDKGISNNLTMISLECNEEYGEETINFIGNLIDKDYSFEEFDVFRYDSYWKIKEYGFQPIFSKYSIKIKTPNRIEFNKKMNENEVNSLIQKLMLMIEVNRGDYY